MQIASIDEQQNLCIPIDLHQGKNIRKTISIDVIEMQDSLFEKLVVLRQRKYQISKGWNILILIRE